MNNSSGKLSVKRLLAAILAGVVVLVCLSALTNITENFLIRLGVIFLIIVDLGVILAAAKAIGDLKFERR